MVCRASVRILLDTEDPEIHSRAPTLKALSRLTDALAQMHKTLDVKSSIQHETGSHVLALLKNAVADICADVFMIR
jgi:hypothetical protein